MNKKTDHRESVSAIRKEERLESNSSLRPPPSALRPPPSSLPLVIVNPASAGGATGAAWPGMASDLREHFGPFQCVFTERGGGGREIAKREAAAGRQLIIACGGDGSVSEAANGILESGAGAELGILPSGTGGDFRRTLGIPTRPADAALALRRGRTELIDVGRVEYVNPRGESESRYFVNIASCGMGGEVIERVKKEKSRWLPARHTSLFGGRAAYAYAALQTTLTYERPTVVISLDGGEERRLTVANLCVANARYFGGGMKIAPDAKLDDDQLDVIAIGDMDALDILSNVHKLYLGTHLGLQQVHHAPARRLTVRAIDGEPVLLEVDGELVGTLPATFEVVPRALRVRC
ncbi:MAG: diacylglycerol/lipid kinase family protein [Pyrinomonadaceae bacterium]